MKKIFYSFLYIFSLSFMVEGCTADVDLNNIDTSTSVNASIALPIGSVSATIGDLIGGIGHNVFIDSIRNKGVLTFRDTFTIEREFHNLDLSQYISSTTVEMNVYDKLPESPFFYDGMITGNDYIQIPLTFPIDLELEGINHDEDYQRLDSALIRDARFVSRISRIGGLPLEWEWIDKVTLDLGEVFSRPQGNTLTIYTKGDGYGYDQDIDINLDKFTINLMKDKHLDPKRDQEKYYGNVIDSCTMTITMYVTVPSSAGQIYIPSTAGFKYELDVQFIDYEAVWGMFEASNHMSVNDEINLSASWPAWRTLHNARLPFAEPSIDTRITTQIAGALTIHGDYLYAASEQGDKVYAEFEGKRDFYKYFSPNEYLPLTSAIGDSATMHILFDKDPQRGRIDQLFSMHPDALGYKFEVDFNRQETPQIRITNNTGIRIDAICDLPFIFNEGIALTYTDTISDIDLSNLTIDSLLSQVVQIDSLQEATLKLAFTIKNSIPLQLRGILKCLDADGNVVMDNQTGKPFQITENDTILIPAPEHQYDSASDSWHVTPIPYTQFITVYKEDYQLLNKIKSIVFEVILDDKSLQHAFEVGNFNIRLTEHERLVFTIGIGADMKAVLNLDSFNE